MPTAVGFALIGAWRAARWLAEARYRARFQALPPEPIERLEADLRRLRAELEDTETRSGLTAKHHRVQAVRGAYLDALSAACRRLDIDRNYLRVLLHRAKQRFKTEFVGS